MISMLIPEEIKNEVIQQAVDRKWLKINRKKQLSITSSGKLVLAALLKDESQEATYAAYQEGFIEQNEIKTQDDYRKIVNFIMSHYENNIVIALISLLSKKLIIYITEKNNIMQEKNKSNLH